MNIALLYFSFGQRFIMFEGLSASMGVTQHLNNLWSFFFQICLQHAYPDQDSRDKAETLQCIPLQAGRTHCGRMSASSVHCLEWEILRATNSPPKSPMVGLISDHPHHNLPKGGRGSTEQTHYVGGHFQPPTPPLLSLAS